MATHKLPKVRLQAMLNDEDDALRFVSETVVGTGRWTITYRAVFQDADTGNYYSVNYDRGATEYQEEIPFEYSDDEVECTLLKFQTRIVTELVPTK